MYQRFLTHLITVLVRCIIKKKCAPHLNLETENKNMGLKLLDFFSLSSLLFVLSEVVFPHIKKKSKLGLFFKRNIESIPPVNIQPGKDLNPFVIIFRKLYTIWTLHYRLEIVSLNYHC